MAANARLTPATSTAAPVVRTRIEPMRARIGVLSRGSAPSSTIGVQSVADTADGLERASLERSIELVAEVSDVHLDDVGVPFEVVVPHVLEDRGLRHDLALAPEEELEKSHLARREVDLDLSSPRSPSARVESEIPGLQDGGSLSRTAADERPQPSEKDDERERLGHIVIGAGVQR